MNCSPHDLRDYLLGELEDQARREVETHAKACASCQEELESLRATRASLLTLRDEEIPQRIAFVSDKVYEPSAVRRWWSGVWNSGPRLIFASAAILSVALVAASFTSQAGIDRAVAQVEARYEQRRRADIEAVAKAFDLMDRQVKEIYRTSYYGGGSQ